MNAYGNSDVRVNQQVSTTYVCGKCGKNQEFKPRDNLICKECNGRIFYKKRTRKPVQFEAR